MNSSEKSTWNVQESGDTDARHLLYHRHASTILTYVSRLLAHPQDAEDVTLEVFTAALHQQELLTLSPERQLAWLRRVARNKVIDRYRHSTHIDFVPLEHSLEFVDDDLTPEQATLQRESYEHLYSSLSHLTTLQQHILQLRYGNGLPFAEIAEILHQSPSTVRKTLTRALHALRASYERHEKNERRNS